LNVHLKPYASIPELFKTKKHIKQVRIDEILGFGMNMTAFADAEGEPTFNKVFKFGLIVVYGERQL
jgi:hypothetical protein